jgi:Family of unknown function (DUF6519)
MRGDFSRLSFDRTKHYRSVRLQQGRVLLDADFNEQASIREESERLRAVDIVGRSGVPLGGSFSVEPGEDGALVLTGGRLYVGGLCCELDESLPVEKFMRAPLDPVLGRTDLLYVDAWEREITAIDDPDLLEPALGGQDTTTRLKVAWVVEVARDIGDKSCSDAIESLQFGQTGNLRVAVTPEFGGLENSLYRVEIHDGGPVGSASFKWSRDNASAIFPVAEFIGSDKVLLRERGSESPLALERGDWVELSSKSAEALGLCGELVQVAEVNDIGRVIRFDRPVDALSPTDAPRIRRWDQQTGPAIAITTERVALEPGFDVRFSGGEFRSGDYWTIPVRPSAGTFEWAVDRPPQGIEHRVAPLALVSWEREDGSPRASVRDCRRPFRSLTEVEAELAKVQLELAEIRARLALVEKPSS